MDLTAILGLGAGGLAATYVYLVAVVIAARLSWQALHQGLLEPLSNT